MRRFNPEKVGEKIARLLLLEQGYGNDEKRRQDQLANKIDKLKLRAPEDSSEEKITDEKEEEPEEEDAEVEAKPKPDVEAGAEKSEEETGEGGEAAIGGQGKDFEVTAPAYIPTQLNIKDIERQLNNLRAGKSLKDKEISGELENYFAELGQGERQALFTYLASLAAIMTGGTSGAAAPRPATLDVDVEIEPQADSDSPAKIKRDDVREKKPWKKGGGKQPMDRSAPIVVGEMANKYRELTSVFENSSYGDQHRCVGGKVVPFGSQRCVQDLDDRIGDAIDQRDSLAGGTADRASLNGTLKYLRQKRRRAGKLAEADAASEETDEKVQGRLNFADEA
jgi:hypothetical protein